MQRSGVVSDTARPASYMEHISPRRYVEFLDDISNYFVPGAISPPLEHE